MIYNLLCLVTFASLLVVSSGGPPNITCGLNEVPERCHEPCPPTCRDRNRAPCPTFRCSEGCGCAPGFIRLRDGGDCIPEKRCPIVDPPLCPANQTYQTSGYDCSTCRVDIKIKCAEINDHKCYCNTGYVRLQNGNCVQSEDCPDDEKCDSKGHWIFSRCGNCNNNCASIGQPPKPCPCSPGCICKDPYVDNGQHTCVLKENCPGTYK